MKVSHRGVWKDSVCSNDCLQVENTAWKEEGNLTSPTLCPTPISCCAIMITFIFEFLPKWVWHQFKMPLAFDCLSDGKFMEQTRVLWCTACDEPEFHVCRSMKQHQTPNILKHINMPPNKLKSEHRSCWLIKDLMAVCWTMKCVVFDSHWLFILSEGAFITEIEIQLTLLTMKPTM